ncbi:MAG: S24/S26 family peptidase [Acidobacteriia bacterium]|nr:S24/S26 family peptidase [Terriglobia bacterium]
MTPWQESWNAKRSALAADALRRGGRLRLRVRGESMLPSVWPGDMVEIADCHLEDVHPGEIVLALREDRLFLHRFLARRGDEGFLLRGDSMAAPDPMFPLSAFQGRLVHLLRTGTIALPVPLRPWSRALGVLLCYCGIARRFALRVHSWRTSHTIPLEGSLANDRQGAR